VVYGPKSLEDRYYLEHAPKEQLGVTALVETLRSLDFLVTQIDPTSETFLAELRAPDLLFLNVHGEYGEDGRIQGLLDYLERPYTGSGVLASALCLNKVIFKYVMISSGIPTPRFALLTGHQSVRQLARAGYPLMVKPVTGGSSLGARLLKDGSSVEAWLAGDHRGQEDEFAETFIAGRSLTVGVLELNRAMVAAPPLEVVCDADFYDADTKLDEHAKGLIEYRVPNLSPEADKGLRATAVRIHKLTRCRGFSRVDFVLGEDGVPYVLEANTAPGMAYQSNFPVAMGMLGLTYEMTVLAMLRSCLCPKDR
jgi:D-alanine-D-alanine ligase